MIKKLLRIPKRYIARQLGVSLTPQISNPERVTGLEHCILWPSTRIICHCDKDSQGKIILGKGVYLGRNVELAVSRNSILCIGSHTSIQDDTIIHGDVEIGQSCAFAKNAHVGSTSHLFREKPYWLIKDQDSLLAPNLSHESLSKKVIIEDDCWIGWGVVIMPGVYIGKGAVIGANTVVTRHVPPYSVQAGTPNSEISQRLWFNPPQEIHAMNDEHLPYFYKGFDLSQASLLQSRLKNIIHANHHARIVLKKDQFSKMLIKGIRKSKNLMSNQMLNLQIFLNGSLQFETDIENGEFSLKIPVDNNAEKHFEIHDMLKQYQVVDIVSNNERTMETIDKFGLGVQSVALTN